MWKRIFDHFAGFGIEPADHIQIVGGIPDAVIEPDGHRVGKSVQCPGQIIFLESLRLGIEVADLSLLKFAEPDRAVGVDHDSAFVRY